MTAVKSAESEVINSSYGRADEELWKVGALQPFLQKLVSPLRQMQISLKLVSSFSISKGCYRLKQTKKPLVTFG